MIKIPARFDNIKEIKKIFPEDLKVIGVGVSAFQRSGLGYILPNYEILSLLETNDLEAIRKTIPVTSIEKDLGGEWPEKLNTSSILKLKKVQEWLFNLTRHTNFLRAHSYLAKPDETLRSKKFILPASSSASACAKINLFVYKAATPLDPIIDELGVRLLSSPGWVRKPLEDKKVFRDEAQLAGIRIPKGENLAIIALNNKRWEGLKQKYGERLVFQLTDYSTGGGQGTFFVDKQANFDWFHEFAKSEERKKTLNWVNVCERVEGRAASITGCATKHGVVTGVLQTQIMDQPELVGFRGRSGVWLGHDWNVRFSETAQLNAETLCQKWGEHIYKKGYKGIYGLDVVVTAEDEIVAIECNSRYTGAFPVYTMLQLSQGEMPLDVWHLAEWLRLDYEMDIKAVQKVSRLPKKGAHIIMHNLETKEVKAKRQVRSGVYSFAPQPVRRARSFATPLDVLSGVSPDILCASVADGTKIVAPALIQCKRPGFSLMDIKAKNEFVLCDRIPNKDQIVKPSERMGKLIFKQQIIDDKGNLLPEIKGIIKEMYQGFGVKENG